jgi:NTE family protein
MGNRSFSSLRIPFAAVAADIEKAEEVVITEGLLIKAIRASISIPGIFTPALLKGRVLVDGGLMTPVPVDVVKYLGADYIIAVDVSPTVKTDSVGITEDLTEISENEPQIISSDNFNDNLAVFVNKTINWDKLKNKVNELTQGFWDSKIREPVRLNVFKILISSWNIVENQITELQLARHKPDLHIKPGLDNIGLFDFQKAGEIIKIGEIEARKKLKAILPDQKG